MLVLLKINRIKTKFINYLHYQISHSSIFLGELASINKRRRRDINTSLVHEVRVESRDWYLLNGVMLL